MRMHVCARYSTCALVVGLFVGCLVAAWLVQKTVIAQVDLHVANTKCISSFRHVTGVTAQGRGAGEVNIA